MERMVTDTILSVGVLAAFFGGIGFIVEGSAAFATVGIVLIILSVVLFFPRMKNFLVKRDERARR